MKVDVWEGQKGAIYLQKPNTCFELPFAYGKLLGTLDLAIEKPEEWVKKRIPASLDSQMSVFVDCEDNKIPSDARNIQITYETKVKE